MLTAAGIASCGLERTVTLAQQHARLPTTDVGVNSHCQIGDAVAIKVSHRDRGGAGAGGIALGGQEGAVPFARQDTDGIFVYHGEVRDAVTVEVPHRHGYWIAAGGVGGSSDKTEYSSLLQ